MRPPKLPATPNLGKIDYKPPKTEIRPVVPPPRYAAIPEGPAMYTKARKAEVSQFPGEPPPQFLDPTLHGSASEYYIYAALWKYFDDQPRDGYRNPPFAGSPEGKWLYQSWQLGGRATTGGAVADFEIPAGRYGQSMILRLQTSRFHLTAGPRIVGADDLQRERLGGDHRIVDLYEQDFLHLRGADLVRYIANVLSGEQRTNPVPAGTYRRSRR